MSATRQWCAGDAAPYVNQVRARAGLPAVTTINAEVVANERRHELAFENHRWYDLLRTGKAIEVMTAYGQNVQDDFLNNIRQNKISVTVFLVNGVKLQGI